MTEEQLTTWDDVYGPISEDFRSADLTGEDLVRWKYQRYMRDYLASIRSVDDNLGRLLDYIEESGLAENTVVIYNSDQGFFLGEHGWFDKRWMYEESLRAPLEGRTPRDWRDAIYYHYYELPGAHSVQRRYGVRTDRYKLIHYYLIDEWELFDLATDPDELGSVYDDPSYTEIRGDLEARLAELRVQYSVPDVDPVPPIQP